MTALLTSLEPVEEEKEKKSDGTLFSAQGPHPNLQPFRFVSLAEKKTKFRYCPVLLVWDLLNPYAEHQCKQLS